MRLARRLSKHYGATAVAWRGGVIRVEHARVIAGGVDAVLAGHARRIRRERAVAGDSIDPAALSEQLAQLRRSIEDALLGAATPTIEADGIEQPGASPEQLRSLLVQARILADPDGASDEQMARELGAKLRI